MAYLDIGHDENDLSVGLNADEGVGREFRCVGRVSLAVGEFEERGLLTRRRGFISIRSRPMLEIESCECYQVFKAFNSELGLRT